MNKIIFNGYASTDFGLVVDGRNTHNAPERDVTLLEDAYKELKASLDPEYAKEYAAQKAELAEKRARAEAETAAREAKQTSRKESRAAKKAAKQPETKTFEQCSDEDYTDIEDID